jgi:hypothetical protein
VFVNEGATAAADQVSAVFNPVTNGGTGTTNGWRATGRFRLHSPVKSQWGVMGMCISDGSKFEFWGLGGQSNVGFVLSKWNSATSKNGATAYQIAYSDGSGNDRMFFRDLWLRIYYDTTQINYQWSLDGYTWTTLQTEALNSFTKPAYVGWGGGWNALPSGWTGKQLLFECQSWKYEDL